MIVREATAEDIPGIAIVATSSFIDAFSEHIEPQVLEKDIEDNRSEKYFETVLGEDEILIAAIDDQIVAYIQFGDVHHTLIEVTSDDIELRRLYVLTKYLRKGIGSQLMDAMLSHPRVTGKSRMLLRVWDINEKAIALYEKYGFVNTGERYPYFFEGKEVGHDDIYAKDL